MHFFFNMQIISISPKRPKRGNKKFTKFEKPKLEIKIPVMHMIPANCGKKPFWIAFSKKAIPIDIAVVKIDSKIIMP